MIPFNKPPVTGAEEAFVIDSIRQPKMSGDGPYSKRCHQWFEESLQCHKALLTPSCTHALELAAMLINIGEGDEVIMPSFTFVSTANAFVLRGAKIVFVDIRPDTQNIDETKIEQAITKKTKAIVAVHYAGVACEMNKIMAIAQQYNLFVIEDAAQGMMSTYQGKALGTIGHIGAYSFHETKNYTSGGEGGLLIVNAAELAERAEILREKGTNRSQFFRGMVDKYSWVDIGSSNLLNDLSAAFLWGQLQKANEINSRRLEIFQTYMEAFLPLKKEKDIQLPTIPDNCKNNGHMFYLKCTSLEQRTDFISFMQAKGILAVFHYIPLHTSVAGKRFGTFVGDDKHTSPTSDTLVRLPLFFNLSDKDIQYIISSTLTFFGYEDNVQ
ncbi:MAG: dTDP-4-amino-4,6-dideoxygalactose transaminase [Hahellaceae bacterium]|nr:dTDP-4-amino-4,6-dideoxygalactose transaminase [Hahellaceae bacterium]MCP5168641.1 dTDP-4-amino-4,6-dideoxygalactose transaminase [Hahellaceae bacterium]